MSKSLVENAVLNAAISVTNDLGNRTEVTPVQATEIAANLPAPYAMESLGPQIFRQGIVALGGYVIGRGWVSSDDWVTISGILITAGPIIWRITRTYLERKKFI